MELLKKHPYLAGGAVILIIGFVVIVAGSGGGTTVDGIDPSTVAAGNALQAAQLAAQAHANDSAAAVQANADSLAARLSLATIEADASNKHDLISQSIALAQINTYGNTTALTSTLAAHVAESQIEAGVTTKQIESATQINTTNAITNALIKTQQIQSNVAMTAIQNQCHGFSCLF